MYFTHTHLVTPVPIMHHISIQQVYVPKLLERLCHNCWAQDFNPVAIWIFNEGNSFHYTYGKKQHMKTKHCTSTELFYVTINSTTAQFKAYSSIREVSWILIKTSDDTSGTGWIGPSIYHLIHHRPILNEVNINILYEIWTWYHCAWVVIRSLRQGGLCHQEIQ